MTGARPTDHLNGHGAPAKQAYRADEAYKTCDGLSAPESRNRRLEFVLPIVLPSLNVRDNMHWAKRSRERDKLVLEVIAAIGGPAHYPRPPFARCRLSVVRHGKKLLDQDNLMSSNKWLADALCMPSRRHPKGLGIIEDDSPDRCEIIASQVKASGKPMRLMTVVTVEELQ